MLEFKSVAKSFSGKRVLNDLSFKVAKGEIVFVIGRSGTGKSVLLKQIVGLLAPDSGEIWLEGKKISGLTEREFLAVRRECAMVFQFPALLDSLSLYDNLAFGLRAHRLVEGRADEQKRISATLDLMGLPGDPLDHFPADLSIGMQKRYAIARAVVIGPKYLLFDEPTTGLDPLSTRGINELIRHLSKALGVTSLVVSHDMHCALEIADRILLLDAGELVFEGMASELMNCEHSVAREFLHEARERLSS